MVIFKNILIYKYYIMHYFQCFCYLLHNIILKFNYFKKKVCFPYLSIHIKFAVKKYNVFWHYLTINFVVIISFVFEQSITFDNHSTWEFPFTQRQISLTPLFQIKKSLDIKRPTNKRRQNKILMRGYFGRNTRPVSGRVSKESSTFKYIDNG